MALITIYTEKVRQNKTSGILIALALIFYEVYSTDGLKQIITFVKFKHLQPIISFKSHSTVTLETCHCNLHLRFKFVSTFKEICCFLVNEHFLIYIVIIN